MKTGISSLLVLSLLFVSNGYASLVGTDNASAGDYSNGWQNNDDGFITGAGAFGPWTLVTPDIINAGFFLSDSRNLSYPLAGADINSSGKAFGMYGANGKQADAYRTFNNSPLSIGQTFSLDLAVNFRDGYKGIDLRNDGDNATIFNFNVGNVGAGDDYTVQFATTGNGSIGNAYSANTVFHLSFTQTSENSGTWTVQRSGGISDLDSGTYTGKPSSFKLYVGNTGGYDERNLYANNLSIAAVPEASAMLAGTLVLGLVACRRLSSWWWKRA